jgi:hypothetical protein
MNNLWVTIRRHLLDPKEERAASEELRAISRWWLEFARNVVTVAGLQLLAEATDNWLLRAVAFVAYSALFLYCFSYFRIPDVFLAVKNENLRVLILLAILLIVLGLGYLLIDAGLSSVIDEIVRLQRPASRVVPGH